MVDSFYRYGSEEELEHAVRTWLWATILWIEDEGRASEISTRRRNGSGLHPSDASES